MISVLILTLDEEVNIAECIDSLPWRNDVYVLDSESQDRTAAIASAMGARVVSRKFTDYADQRNFGLQLPFTNEWIVMLDADERLTPELAAEITRRTNSAPPETAMYRVRRRDMFMGRWLKRSSGYPTWFPRVARKGLVRVERAVNEVFVANGAVEELGEHIDHYPFNKGLAWWFERHNRYSTGEADLVAGRKQAEAWRVGHLFVPDPAVRRAALKGLAYRLPVRPFLVFLYLFVVRLGFLDGGAGFHFASMRMAYEIMIDAKLAQLRRQRTVGA
jgi:glycosyltransferase involved in cell wall biosynthesis